MNDFAISTAWNCSRHNDACGIADEIKAVGFDSIELNFKLTKEAVEGFSPLVKNNQIKIVSLHNYCPLPEGVTKANASPDYYSLASLNKDEKEKALLHTKQTIEYAQLLGAPCVVLHCGKVDIKDNSKRLIRMHLDGKKDSEEFIVMREDMIEQRQKNSRPYLESLLNSLDELNRLIHRGSSKGFQDIAFNSFAFAQSYPLSLQ